MLEFCGTTFVERAVTIGVWVELLKVILEPVHVLQAEMDNYYWMRLSKIS